MIKRYRLRPYMEIDRSLKISFEIIENGEWVKYDDCQNRVQELLNERLNHEKEYSILKERNKMLSSALKWYADIDNWLLQGKSKVSEIEIDQGERARKALLNIKY